MLTYITGDLFTTKRQLIAHGVNAKGVFGAGIAGQIAANFPHVKQAYLKAYREDFIKVGRVNYVVGPGNPDWFANMVTQETYGRTGIHVDYHGLRKCLANVFWFAKTAGIGVAMPKVGAGLGGGDWNFIEKIIQGLLAEHEVEVDVYSL
jgi:O-acetyl-ADP-ribose deacetylase (regulator of RNase III)